MDNDEKFTFITFVGRSEWAVVNSFWAVLFHEEIYPDKIHIITREDNLERAKKCKEGIKAILDGYDIESEIEINETDLDEDLGHSADLVKKICIEDESKKVLDITGGTKGVTSGALIRAVECDVSSIYYLFIDSLEDADRPYLDIPLPRHKVYQLRGGEQVV